MTQCTKARCPIKQTSSSSWSPKVLAGDAADQPGSQETNPKPATMPLPTATTPLFEIFQPKSLSGHILNSSPSTQRVTQQPCQQPSLLQRRWANTRSPPAARNDSNNNKRSTSSSVRSYTREHLWYPEVAESTPILRGPPISTTAVTKDVLCLLCVVVKGDRRVRHHCGDPNHPSVIHHVPSGPQKESKAQNSNGFWASSDPKSTTPKTRPHGQLNRPQGQKGDRRKSPKTTVAGSTPRKATRSSP